MSDLNFEELISQRMEKFNYLLEKGNLNFNQYQYDGVKWCIKNELQHNDFGNFKGGFISDEMGLGKTLTMIGTMFTNKLRRTLIVVPPVLIQQWFKEIYKISGHKSCLFYGTNKKKITKKILNNIPIVLTTYNMLLSDKCILKDIIWSRVIFDEGHYVRNCKTKRFYACKQIRSKIRWIVSGTPIQNKLQDFYNLCCMIGIKSKFYTDPVNTKLITQKYILRRTKQQVNINLPSININKFNIEWENMEEMLFAEEIHSLLPNQSHVSASKRRKLAKMFGKSGVLTALLRARQSCILPNLMRKNMGMFCSLKLVNQDYSSKLNSVIRLILERKDNGKGKIVFCHFRDEIDVIFKRLLEGGMKKVITYDGRNSGGKNLECLSDPADALIIQIQSGCEGLNLQANFSEIYFVSPHWNPFIEDQAIARCHRIGQTKSVDVFKFEMNGFKKKVNDKIDPITLEKYINDVQKKKREISKKIFDC